MKAVIAMWRLDCWDQIIKSLNIYENGNVMLGYSATYWANRVWFGLERCWCSSWGTCQLISIYLASPISSFRLSACIVTPIYIMFSSFIIGRNLKKKNLQWIAHQGSIFTRFRNPSLCVWPSSSVRRWRFSTRCKWMKWSPRIWYYGFVAC